MSKPTPFETSPDFEAEIEKALEENVGEKGAYINGVWVPDKKRTATPAKRVARAERIAKVLDTREYTGGSVSYYQLDILHPTTPKRKPYTVECYDIIEALGMSYSEGNVLKALWRMCAARQGKSKRGYVDAKYDAEKLVFCSQRILNEIVTPKGNKS